MFLGLPFIVASQFFAYESFKKFYMSGYIHKVGDCPEEILKLRHIGTSGMLAGSLISFISCPI